MKANSETIGMQNYINGDRVSMLIGHLDGSLPPSVDYHGTIEEMLSRETALITADSGERVLSCVSKLMKIC